MKCPTCDRPALVKSTKLRARRQTSFKRKLKRKLKRGDSTFQKQDSLKQTLTLNDSTSSSGSAASGNSSPGSPGSPTSDMDDSGCVTGQQTRKDYEFAVCQTCHFKFCIKCKLENHPSKQCNFTPTTPPKQLNKSVACSKDSKKSLRRL